MVIRRRVEEMKEIGATISVLANLIACGTNGRSPTEVLQNDRECTDVIVNLYEKVKVRAMALLK